MREIFSLFLDVHTADHELKHTHTHAQSPTSSPQPGIVLLSLAHLKYEAKRQQPRYTTVKLKFGDVEAEVRTF